MIWKIWQYDWHRIRPLWFCMAFFWLGFLLFDKKPLGYIEPMMIIIMTVNSIMIALLQILTNDNVFLYSLPVVPRRLLLYRMTFGLLLIVGLIMLGALCLAIGLRQAVQEMMGSIWYPSVRPFEYRALWLPLVGGVGGYLFSIGAYFLNQQNPFPASVEHSAKTSLSISLLLALLVLPAALGFTFIAMPYPGIFLKIVPEALVVWFVLAALTSVGVAYHAVHYSEIR